MCILLRRLFDTRSSDFGGMLSAVYAGPHLVAAHFGLRAGPVLHWWFPVYDPNFSSLRLAVVAGPDRRCARARPGQDRPRARRRRVQAPGDDRPSTRLPGRGDPQSRAPPSDAGAAADAGRGQILAGRAPAAAGNSVCTPPALIRDYDPTAVGALSGRGRRSARAMPEATMIPAHQTMKMKSAPITASRRRPAWEGTTVVRNDPSVLMTNT